VSGTSAPRQSLDVERIFVVLVAAHSFAIGLALLAIPEWGARFGGFERLDPLFFARQGGAFHIVVAIGYLMEHLRHRTMTLLLLAKCLGVVFLVTATLLTEVPWVVPMSAVGDGLMAAAALVIRRWSARASDPRG
jgi:hypothetical protein